ncbi:MAG: hypothetical protein LBU22_02350 [Dysgonamonadaceae bacterium]|nr:hypothetical protein [Dysgonamonadaceae bacterium]
MVEELKALGWVFVYIGANQDVDAVADSMSIENKLQFEASERGVDRMMCKERASREVFYKKVADNSSGIYPEMDLKSGFFEEDDASKKMTKNKFWKLFLP